jgi:hypothetical protein
MKMIKELCDEVQEDIRTFNAKTQRLKGAKKEISSNFKFFFASLRPGVFALNSGLRVFAFLCGK